MKLLLFYIVFVAALPYEVVIACGSSCSLEIQKYSQCPGVACFVACSAVSNVQQGKSCIECPICGPNGQPCPLYKCSTCTSFQMYDKDGCKVCNACNPEPCPNLDCVKPDLCGNCTELSTPKSWNGCPGCSECRRSSFLEPLQICNYIKCGEPTCPYGTIATALTDSSGCCRTCNQCQQSPKCKSLICQTPTCPKGYISVEQTDALGCRLCSTCKKDETVSCPDLDCPQPECIDCAEVVTPTLANGCSGCPECRAKFNLNSCNNIRCAAPGCASGFISYISKDSQGCCQGCSQCQTSLSCPDVVCEEEPKCPKGYNAELQYDSNGCQLCKSCRKSTPDTCPKLDCAEPICDKCSEKYTPTLENGCIGCPECRADSNLHSCNNIRCAAPGCANGFISYISTDSQGCCKGCSQCQPWSTCPDIICDPSPKCPSGCVAEQQFDSNGCKLCKICIKSKPHTCPRLKCKEPICGLCAEIFTPILANGCRGCPECRAKLPINGCNNIRCAAPSCASGFISYISTDSQGCCRGCLQCQPSSSCPDVICEEEPKCPKGYNAELQYDSNGCQLCKSCKKSTPDTCPTLECAEPICGKCAEKYTPTLENGCIGCPECRGRSDLTSCIATTCLRPNCDAGFRTFVFNEFQGCCVGCSECQPNPKCTDVLCDDKTKCPKGSVLETQYDSNGCKLCSYCKKTATAICSKHICTEPICGPCAEKFTPMLSNGCAGCPECRGKSGLNACFDNAETCRKPRCSKGFLTSVLNARAQGCCVTCSECQPNENCSNVLCDDSTKCPKDSIPVAQYDPRGCALCTKCIPYSSCTEPDNCPELHCGPEPTCKRCEQLVTQTLPNGCPGCPTCQPKKSCNECLLLPCAFPGPCKKCEELVTPTLPNGCPGCPTCQPKKSCNECPQLNCPLIPTQCKKCEELVTPILQNGCHGCPTCRTKKPCNECPPLHCPRETACGQCSKLAPTTRPDGCAGCSECAPSLSNGPCSFIRCKPNCPFDGYINYIPPNCCPATGCSYECQPKPNCPTIVCDKCAEEYTTISQTDEKGCKKCPTCVKKTCPLLNCPACKKGFTRDPTNSPATPPAKCPKKCPKCVPCIRPFCPAIGVCGRCSIVENTNLANGCEGCPQCKLQPAIAGCPQFLCIIRPCESYINYFSPTCCRGCEYECQVSPKCPILTCDRCASGTKTVPQTDNDGCQIACPKCLSS